jgi:predicted ribosome quality control (RQC) complex YloA/Tae2 family protein
VSLFDKLFTVESVDSKNTATAPIATAEPVAVNAVVNTAEGVVTKIYAQNELSEEGNSIYAVSKLMNTLPKEMTTPKMQQTIAGILAVTEKSVPALIADAHKRIEVLNAARDTVIAERTEEIVSATSDIERLKQAIEVAEKVIKNAEDVMEATKHQIADEVEELEKLVKFSEGMVNQG